MTQYLCIELHDVAPATWPHCRRLLDLVDELGAPPLTLLAVPHFHKSLLLADAPDFVRSLRGRIERGDEVALHGYFHHDDAPPPRQPLDWLRRRVLTAGEGEFAALTQREAAQRIARGCSELRKLCGAVAGFVAPAWLSSAGTWDALRASPLRYAATRDALVVLDGMRRVVAPAISASARSRWRRLASRAWLRRLARTNASAPLVRVALHPADAEHPDLTDAWRRLITRLLQRRTPVTTARALHLS